MPRILYFAPDFAQPSGGVQVLYEHVAILRSAGMDAWILHSRPGWRYPHAGRDVPVMDISRGLEVDRTDWLVLPEDQAGPLSAARSVDCGKVLFCQNHFLLPNGLPGGGHWRDLGIGHYLCVSDPIRRALEDWFGVRAAVVRPAVPEDLFRPSPRTPNPTVAFMPRKGAYHSSLARWLLAQLARDEARLRVEWRPIEGLARRQVAELLGSTWVYLATGYHEGLGLPPLEAMASGCVVVGFEAGGGLDYADERNGVWVPDEAAFDLAAALRDTLRAMADPTRAPRFEAMREAARATAARYSVAAQREALLGFWAGVGLAARRSS